MDDFGGKLRQARERRGVSLRQIAANTKISIAALEALERNDISRLPGGIFSRAFVRSYAIEVGLDPDATVREFLERFHGDAPRATTATPSAPLREDEGNFESQQRMASVLLKLVAISLPIAAIILYFTMRQQPRRVGSAEPEPPVQPSPAAEAANAPASPQPIESNPPTAAPQPVVPPQPAAAHPTGQPLTLELHPTGPCWVSLTVDGKRIFGRVMQPGEKDVREVHESAVIEIGDAGAFAFSINGRPGRSLGESGQVRTARITRDTMAQYLQ